MKMKKILAAVLSLLMLLALFPTVALAVDGEGSGNAEGIKVSKTAELVSDGTYTITLEAYATGTTTTVTETKAVPLDIVLVLDQSGSMAYNDNGYSTNTASDRRIYKLQASLRTFVNSILNNSKGNDNIDHKVAIAGYASDEDMGRSSNISGIGYNGSDSYWVNTGLYINGAFKNYETVETVNSYSPVYGNSISVWNSYYVLVDGSYVQVYRAGNYNNRHWEYNYNGQTVTVVPMTSETDTNSDHVQFYSYESSDVSTPLSPADYQSALASVNVGGVVNSTILGSIDLLKASGGTCTEYGMLMAQNVFANNPIEEGSDRKRVVILFTDGETDSTANTVYGYADGLKSTYGATVYCVGFGSSVDTSFLNRISSNYDGSGEATGETKYSMLASNQTELENIFQNIFKDIETPSTSVTLGTSSVMKDIIGTAFDLPAEFTEASNISVKTVAGSTTDGTTITWGAETLNPAGVYATADTENNKVEVTGFDYADKYIAPSHDGEKLVVTITGVEATEAAATGEAVPTNGELSGIYENGEAAVPVKAFEQPLTVIGNKTYVLDYAKTAELTELGQSATHLDGEAMRKITGNSTALSETYGNVSVSSDGVLTYTPKTTNWDGYDSFFAFGTKDSGYSWSKVSVLPANNVYYEDDFITGVDGVALGIVYSGVWTVDGKSAGNTETANNPVQGGWVEGDTGLSDDAAYSDGSAHKADASSGNKATATFTFTGTGVDIYSKTDMTTGTIIATLKNSANNENKVSKTFIVDNKSASGTYYQIPTVTFSGLVHGEYTVTITVTTGAANDGNRCTYYLDGIRVYNPIQDKESESTVQNAYKDELSATFTEVRDLLKSGYTAFIDEGLDENGNRTGVSTVGDYTTSEYGPIAPEHEIYLANGQSVVLGLSGTADKYYIGLKAPSGTATTANISAGGTTKTSVSVSSASDLYYVVVPNDGNTITVENTGSGLLSITKLRTTLAAGSGASGVSFLDLDDETALNTYTAFTSYSMVAYNAAPATEEELEEQEKPEATEPEDPEVTEPETPAEEGPGDVVIDNPTEPEKPADEVRNEFINWLTDLFNSMRKIIGRR